MKTVLVVGATGQQGRSVIRALCQSREYRCLALTRDVSSPKAQRLASLERVELVTGDLDDTDQLRSIFKKAEKGSTGAIWGVFVALAYPGLGAGGAREEAQGKNIATIANEFSIQSYIHSTSIPSATRDKPYEVGSSGHAKFAIEGYVSSLDIPWTIIRPGFFMENFSPGMIGRVMDGVFRHSFPAECKIQFVAVDDIGRFSHVIFDDPPKFKHKVFDLAGDTLTPKERAEVFCRATGHDFPGVPMLLTYIIHWLNRDVQDIVQAFIRGDEIRREDPNGYDANLNEASGHVKLTKFEEWATQWDQRSAEEINEYGVTIWGLISGKTWALLLATLLLSLLFFRDVKLF